MNTDKKALDLLVSSLHKGTEGRNGEWELLGSALQSSGVYSRSADDVLSLLKKSKSQEICLLPILENVIHNSPVEQLRECSHKWVEYISQQLQTASNAATAQSACKCISILLDRCHDISKGMSDFTSRQLPAIMTSLICFSAADCSLQCIVLPVVSKCLVYYPKPCSQYKAQLTKWANSGLFLSSQQLSQECSRLLVLVHASHALIDSMCEQLHAVLTVLYGDDHQVPNRTIEVPSLPSEEPNRSAHLLRVFCVLSRTLCYCLLLTTSRVSVESVLGVTVGGLQRKQQQVTGLSYDALVLRSILPTVHTALFNILSTLIKTCHSHLLRYTTIIEACIIQTMTADNESEPLLKSVHRCLRAWVSLRQDTDNYFITLTSSALLKAADSAACKSSFVRLSALNSLSVIVRNVGVLLPSQVCEPLRKLIVKGFSLSTPPQQALAVLDLLLACVTSSHAQLRPSLGSALELFNMGTQHQSGEVREFCESALFHCRLIQHPVVPPLLTPHPPEQLTVTSQSSNSFLSMSAGQSLFPAPQTTTAPLSMERTLPPSSPMQSAVPLLPSEEPIAPPPPSVELASPPPSVELASPPRTPSSLVLPVILPPPSSIEPVVTLSPHSIQPLSPSPPSADVTPTPTVAEEPMDADPAPSTSDHTPSVTPVTPSISAPPPVRVLPEFISFDDEPTEKDKPTEAELPQVRKPMLVTVSDDEDLSLFVPVPPDDDEVDSYPLN